MILIPNCLKVTHKIFISQLSLLIPSNSVTFNNHILIFGLLGNDSPFLMRQKAFAVLNREKRNMWTECLEPGGCAYEEVDEGNERRNVVSFDFI